MKTYTNFIAGQWLASASNKTFKVHNPAKSSELVAEFQASQLADVTSAVDAAAKAFENWSTIPAPMRGMYLAKAAGILRRRRDEAANQLTREEGKPITEARGETDRAIALLDFYAGQASLLTGQTVPSTVPNRFLYTTRSPLGPIALITPWNFPIAIPIWKAAPALICGNTIVLKPAEQAPASACLFAEILEEAGLPKGVFNLVTGGGEVGAALVNDARIRCISFTGSVEVGKKIMQQAGPRLVRIGLEMGGKNPHIVMDDADLDRAAADVVYGAFSAAGHKCTAASRAIVIDKVHDAFVEKLKARIAAFKAGDTMDPQTQLCPLLDETQMKKTLEYVAIGQQEGAKLLAGGHRLTDAPFSEGWYVSPALFTEVKPTMRIAQEEIFGPVLAVIRAKDLNEAITIANGVEFGLSAGISTTNLKTSMEFTRRIEAGVIHVNNPTAGLELQVPFGGLKNSTSGYREMGTAAIDFFSQVKTVYVDG